MGSDSSPNLRTSKDLWRDSGLAAAREGWRQEVGHRPLFTPCSHLAHQPRDTSAGEKSGFREGVLADELLHRRFGQGCEGGNVWQVEVDRIEFAHLLSVGLLVSGHVEDCVDSVGMER